MWWWMLLLVVGRLFFGLRRTYPVFLDLMAIPSQRLALNCNDFPVDPRRMVDLWARGDERMCSMYDLLWPL